MAIGRSSRHIGHAADSPAHSVSDAATAQAALERFVIENDALQKLETRIARFNVFDALGISEVEIRHSNFLAFVLDPTESHGLGDLFLKGLLIDALKAADPSARPFSPISLDGVSLR